MKDTKITNKKILDLLFLDPINADKFLNQNTDAVLITQNGYKVLSTQASHRNPPTGFAASIPNELGTNWQVLAEHGGRFSLHSGVKCPNVRKAFLETLGCVYEPITLTAIQEVANNLLSESRVIASIVSKPITQEYLSEKELRELKEFQMSLFNVPHIHPINKEKALKVLEQSTNEDLINSLGRFFKENGVTVIAPEVYENNPFFTQKAICDGGYSQLREAYLIVKFNLFDGDKQLDDTFYAVVYHKGRPNISFAYYDAERELLLPKGEFQVNNVCTAIKSILHYAENGDFKLPIVDVTVQTFLNPIIGFKQNTPQFTSFSGGVTEAQLAASLNPIPSSQVKYLSLKLEKENISFP